MSSITSAEELQILNIILIFTVKALFVVVCFDLILEVDVHVLALLHFCTPLLLLMIHHEKTRVNANRNPNPKGEGGVRKCNSAHIFSKLAWLPSFSTRNFNSRFQLCFDLSKHYGSLYCPFKLRFLKIRP